MSGRYLFETQLWLPAPIDEVFELFSRVEYLNPLTPRWFDLTPFGEVPERLAEGVEIPYVLRLHRLPLRWTSRITSWRPPSGFTYVQARGPYRYFQHDHLFREVDGGTETIDRVAYEARGGPLVRGLVERDLRRIFQYRRLAAPELLDALQPELRSHSSPALAV